MPQLTKKKKKAEAKKEAVAQQKAKKVAIKLAMKTVIKSTGKARGRKQIEATTCKALVGPFRKRIRNTPEADKGSYIMDGNNKHVVGIRLHQSSTYSEIIDDIIEKLTNGELVDQASTKEYMMMCIGDDDVD